MLCFSVLIPVQKIRAEANTEISQCLVQQNSRMVMQNLAAGEQIGVTDKYNTKTKKQGKGEVQGILRGIRCAFDAVE